MQTVVIAEKSIVDKRRFALKKTGKSVSEIAEILGIHRDTLYHNIEKKELSEKFKRALKEFVGVSLEDDGTATPVKKEGVPYYDIDVFAGNIELADDAKVEYASGFIKIPGFESCDCFLNVYGESMKDKYNPGEIIGLKRVKDYDLISFGEAHMIITAENRVIKYLFQHTKETWLLKSANPEFTEYEIKIKKVLHVYAVKGKVTKDCL